MDPLPPRTSSLEQRSSPLLGLPPLLVPRGEAGGANTTGGARIPHDMGGRNDRASPRGAPEESHHAFPRHDSPATGKTYNSPVPGLPPLIVPDVRGEKNGGFIPALPASPSLDMAFFTGAPPSYSQTSASPQSSTGSRRSGKLPALPSPPAEALPLPPIPRSASNASSTELAPPSRATGTTPRILRSPSPLSPFSGHGEIKPSSTYPSALQGLGLGPVHRDTQRSVSSPEPRPSVHVIASSDRAAHRDLPPIVTIPPTHSAPARTPSRHPPAPAPLDLHTTYRHYPASQLLSPGMATSPGFSPTNVVVDSLIEEMQDDDDHERRDQAGPQRKTSILDRPRPRATSRGSSYRADPITTPTPQQTTFSPSIHPADVNPYYRPTVKLTDIIIHQRIQQALLPHLSIASFLALLGALDKHWRRSISGEMVGKWVVREWGLMLGNDVAWPGLGVWEGFLESLLHTPEAYPTYPPHFTTLLRHLSLSHTLIVLFLRSLPPTAFPTIPPFPFEDDPSTAGLSHSVSSLSLSTGPRSRTVSGPGSEYSGGGGRPPFIPKAERVVELVMPEPLSAIHASEDSLELLSTPTFSDAMTSRQHKRRSSLGATSFVSWTRETKPSAPSPPSGAARQGKKHSAPPPVSFPSAKRYVFKGFGEPTFSHSRKRNSFDGGVGGPGSIFSVDDVGGRSLYGDSSGGSTFPSRYGQNRSRIGLLGGEQHSLSTKQSSSLGHHSPSTSSLARFAHGNGGAPSTYDDRTATSSPTFSRIRPSTPQPVEPAFQKPIPYVVGRAPILRVFVPLSTQVREWPCAEGAQRARHELERCGAWQKLRLGDVVVNTALKDPLSSRHLMLFVPTIQPYLVPLEYRFSPEGHLPAYFDAFKVPPSYYYPLLSPPYIITPDLSPWADNAINTIRLAFERSDITTTRGEKVIAKRYLHVCGFEITSDSGHLACEDWQGMVTLEAEGTAEGRASLLRRLGRSTNESRIPAERGPWEIIREKSLGGTVWLRLIPDKAGPMSPA